MTYQIARDLHDEEGEHMIFCREVPKKFKVVGQPMSDLDDACQKCALLNKQLAAFRKVLAKQNGVRSIVPSYGQHSLLRGESAA